MCVDHKEHPTQNFPATFLLPLAKPCDEELGGSSQPVRKSGSLPLVPATRALTSEQGGAGLSILQMLGGLLRPYRHGGTLGEPSEALQEW